MFPNFFDRITGNSSNNNNAGSRNIYVYDSEPLEGLITSSQRQQQQQQQQQQASTSTPTSTSTTASTNQSIFNNIRLGAPICILRAPEDLNLPSTYNDDDSSDLTAILLPSNFGGSLPSNQSVEGKFCDKFPLHVLPVEEGENNNLFTNRISYNAQVNGYYENGILSKKYLNKWQEGTYQWDNIELKREYDWSMTYLARDPSNMNDDGEISWKFDYRPGSFIINSLHIRFSFGTFDLSARVDWYIKPLPTMKNPNPTWQSIQFDPYTEERHYVNEIKDVTQFVKNEYGFLLKAHLSGGETNNVVWQKTQLFRRDFTRASAEMDLNVDDDETFGLDVKVELKPDIIVEPLPESFDFVLNDETTSDFVIHLEVPTSDEQSSGSTSSDLSDKEIKDFHVHSKILSSRSNYFNALLESSMIESQTKSLTLSQISYESLDMILNFLYTGRLPEILTYDQWITLLRDASRFLIPTLIQRCEKALKGYLNDGGDIEAIAEDYGAEQLSQYCKMLEPKEEQS